MTGFGYLDLKVPFIMADLIFKGYRQRFFSNHLLLCLLK